MKTSWLGTVAALAALSAGCATNNESLFIRQVPVPDPQSKCAVTNDPTAPLLLEGTLDAALTSQYSQIFLVGDQMAARGDAVRLHPETSRAVLNEVDVEIFDNGTSIDKITVPTSGFIDQAQDTTPSYGLSEVDPVITTDDLNLIKAAHPKLGVFVVARITMHGKNLGGLKVSTGPFDFPIFVCQSQVVPLSNGQFGVAGCIRQSQPSACTDQLVDACVLGQDAPHDCREVAGALSTSSKPLVCSAADGTICK